jgi:hypothetical protein
VGEDDMDKELIIKLAAEAAVNAAMNYLAQQNQKEKKSRHDKRLRNTKLLLKHYLCRWFTFDGVKIASICESEGIDESTYYRDICEACPKLSVLIFGIDGIS